MAPNRSTKPGSTPWGTQLSIPDSEASPCVLSKSLWGPNGHGQVCGLEWRCGFEKDEVSVEVCH